MVLAKLIIFWTIVFVAFVAGFVAWDTWVSRDDMIAALVGMLLALIICFFGAVVIIVHHSDRAGSDSSRGFPVRLVDQEKQEKNEG